MTSTRSERLSGITRKAFLRRGAAAGAALVLPGFGAWNSVAMADEPAHAGGILDLSIGRDPGSLHPISNTSSTILTCIAPCYNGLVVFDPLDQDVIIGDLAESWEFSPDGTALTFKLVSGAKFHDGTPMTSADVKATFDLVRNPPPDLASPRKDTLAAVTSIDSQDELTVRFNLSRPSPSLLTNLAAGWMLVLPKHILDEDVTILEGTVIGTGPFKWQNHISGVSIELVKNPEYHVPDRPLLDGVTCHVIPDQGTAISYLTTGQLDLIPQITGQAKGLLSSSPNVTVLEGPGSTCYGVTYNTTLEPFNNIELRKATTLAIDREAALSVLANGSGQLAGIALPGPWMLPKSELEQVPGYGLDVDANRAEARRIMEQEGFADGLPITMLVRRTEHHEATSVFVQDQWARIGINATLQIEDSAAFFERVSKGEFQVHASGAGSYTVIEPDAIFTGLSGCAASQPFWQCDQEVEQLFQRQSQTLDFEERRALVNELEVVLLNRYNVSYLFWPNRQMAMSTDLMDMRLHSNIDNNMRMQSVWLSA